MKRLILLIAIFLSACAPSSSAPQPTSPAPTRTFAATSAPAAQPTSAAKPTTASSGKTVAPSPTQPGIAMLNIKQEKQADGSVHTTANVSAAENLGVGQMELAYPEIMLQNESRSIRLRISPAQQFVSLTPVAAPGKTPDVPSFVYKFSGNVQLYPIMFAELRGLNFEMDQKGPIRRIVESNKPVEWTWVVRALAPGRQELALELAIPIIVNGVASEMSTHVLQDLTIAIQVNAPPAPATATPKSATERMIDSIIDNTGAILVAVIGILGTIFGGILALLKRNNSQ